MTVVHKVSNTKFQDPCLSRQITNNICKHILSRKLSNIMKRQGVLMFGIIHGVQVLYDQRKCVNVGIVFFTCRDVCDSKKKDNGSV